MLIKAILLAARNTPASPPPPPPPPPALSAFASPAFAYGERTTTLNFAQVTSWAISLSISGGTAPYTVSWARLSGDEMEILSPGVTGTRFRGMVRQQSLLDGVYRATITDAAMASVTVDVNVQLVHYGDYSGGLAVLF